MQELENEQRIIDKNWEHYSGTKAVFKPAKMTPQQLEEGRTWIKQEFYSYANIYKRVGFSGENLLNRYFYNVLKKGGTSKIKPKEVFNPHS